MSASESCLESLERSTLWARISARLSGAVGNLYCRTFHREISRPVNGRYRCWRCLREFDLGW
jgi:hypothetical protein